VFRNGVRESPYPEISKQENVVFGKYDLYFTFWKLTLDVLRFGYIFIRK